MDTEAATEARRIVKRAVEETADLYPETEEAILTGYVLVSEWVDASGDKFLTTHGFTGSIERPPTAWTVRGWLHEILFRGSADR